MAEDTAVTINPIVEHNLERIKKDLGGSDDLVIREIRFNEQSEIAAAVVYIDGLSDTTAINHYIYDVLNHKLSVVAQLDSLGTESFAKELLVGVGSINTVTEMASLFTNLLSGEAIILLKDTNIAYRADVREWKGREVTESTNQTSVRGPRESFTETLRTNTSLIRRKIKDPRLWLETISIGEITKTGVSIMYINGLAKPSVVDMVRTRLNSILSTVFSTVVISRN